MCDVYIYKFVTSSSENGENMISKRPATLEAIEHAGGEPLMASQIVVDQTQLDADGFLVHSDWNESEMDTIAAQIWCMERRAASREMQAVATKDETERYNLSLESRELLKQARKLKSRHAEAMAAALDCAPDSSELLHFGRGLST